MSKRIHRFPFHRLPRFSRSELLLDELVHRRHIEGPVAAAVSQVAARLGLGGAGLEVRRSRVVTPEELPRLFPGRWRFGVLGNPLAERLAFVALDPVLLQQVAAALGPETASAGAAAGQHGLAAGLALSLLESLAGEPGLEDLGQWRWLGLADSTGELGRQCLQLEQLLCLWLAVEVGWQSAFVAWLEPLSSCHRATNQSAAGDDEWPGRWHRLPLVGRLQIGGCHLQTGELGCLQVGDVLLLEPGELDYCLRLDPLLVHLQPQGNQARVLGVETLSGGDVVAEQAAENTGWLETVEPVTLPHLPVELTVEAGQVRLALGRLARLRAGDVLELGQAVTGPVAVRAAGQLVGRGELVDVEGQRGVRLLEVYLLRGDGHA